MGLVEYGSDSESDQEEIQPEPQPKVAASTAPILVGKEPPTGPPSNPNPDEASKSPSSSSTFKRKASAPFTHTTSPVEITSGPVNEVEPEPQIQEPEPTDDIGPIQGPARPPQSPSPAPQTPGSEPLSPYSLNRATIRSLTLPTSIPDIPPSPRGEEPPDVTSKFERFRELKKQGIHFNEQLSRSSSLQNPNLFEKLTEFVGVTGGDQYVSCLPKELWDPFGFPEEAFADKLAKSQIEMLEKRQAEERSRIDFVGSTAVSTPPATSPSSRDRRAGNAGGRSAAERVMAGLDRERNGERDTGPRRKESSGRWDERPRERRREGDERKKRSRSSSRERSIGRNRQRDYDRV